MQRNAQSLGNQHLDISEQLLREAESGVSGKKGKAGVMDRKFMGGERTLETNLANINMDMSGLGFDIDPLFHHITAKFDEIKSSSMILNCASLNTECEVDFFKDTSLTKGKEDTYWRLLNPIKAARDDLNKSEENIKNGILPKPKEFEN